MTTTAKKSRKSGTSTTSKAASLFFCCKNRHVEPGVERLFLVEIVVVEHVRVRFHVVR